MGLLGALGTLATGQRFRALRAAEASGHQETPLFGEKFWMDLGGKYMGNAKMYGFLANMYVIFVGAIQFGFVFDPCLHLLHGASFFVSFSESINTH